MITPGGGGSETATAPTAEARAIKVKDPYSTTAGELPRRPRSPAMTIRPQRTPPANPPRCPPMLIPETVKVRRRLIPRITPISRAMWLRPRPLAITKVAPKMPKTAPEAPTVLTRLPERSRAPNEPASIEAK